MVKGRKIKAASYNEERYFTDLFDQPIAARQNIYSGINQKSQQDVDSFLKFHFAKDLTKFQRLELLEAFAEKISATTLNNAFSPHCMSAILADTSLHARLSTLTLRKPLIAEHMLSHANWHQIPNANAWLNNISTVHPSLLHLTENKRQALKSAPRIKEQQISGSNYLEPNPEKSKEKDKPRREVCSTPSSPKQPPRFLAQERGYLVRSKHQHSNSLTTTQNQQLHAVQESIASLAKELENYSDADQNNKKIARNLNRLASKHLANATSKTKTVLLNQAKKLQQSANPHAAKLGMALMAFGIIVAVAAVTLLTLKILSALAFAALLTVGATTVACSPKFFKPLPANLETEPFLDARPTLNKRYKF